MALPIPTNQTALDIAKNINNGLPSSGSYNPSINTGTAPSQQNQSIMFPAPSQSPFSGGGRGSGSSSGGNAIVASPISQPTTTTNNAGIVSARQNFFNTASGYPQQNYFSGIPATQSIIYENPTGISNGVQTYEYRIKTPEGVDRLATLSEVNSLRQANPDVLQASTMPIYSTPAYAIKQKLSEPIVQGVDEYLGIRDTTNPILEVVSPFVMMKNTGTNLDLLGADIKDYGTAHKINSLIYGGEVVQSISSFVPRNALQVGELGILAFVGASFPIITLAAIEGYSTWSFLNAKNPQEKINALLMGGLPVVPSAVEGIKNIPFAKLPDYIIKFPEPSLDIREPQTFAEIFKNEPVVFGEGAKIGIPLRVLKPVELKANLPAKPFNIITETPSEIQNQINRLKSGADIIDVTGGINIKEAPRQPKAPPKPFEFDLDSSSVQNQINRLKSEADIVDISEEGIKIKSNIEEKAKPKIKIINIPPFEKRIITAKDIFKDDKPLNDVVTNGDKQLMQILERPEQTEKPLQEAKQEAKQDGRFFIPEGKIKSLNDVGKIAGFGAGENRFGSLAGLDLIKIFAVGGIVKQEQQEKDLFRTSSKTEQLLQEKQNNLFGISFNEAQPQSQPLRQRFNEAELFREPQVFAQPSAQAQPQRQIFRERQMFRENQIFDTLEEKDLLKIKLNDRRKRRVNFGGLPAYSGFIKRRGVFIPYFSGVPKGIALKDLTKGLRTSLSRTGFIKQSGEETTIQDISFNLDKKVFRDYRQIRGKIQPLPYGTTIKRTSRSFDTPEEKYLIKASRRRKF